MAKPNPKQNPYRKQDEAALDDFAKGFVDALKVVEKDPLAAERRVVEYREKHFKPFVPPKGKSADKA